MHCSIIQILVVLSLFVCSQPLYAVWTQFDRIDAELSTCLKQASDDKDRASCRDIYAIKMELLSKLHKEGAKKRRGKQAHHKSKAAKRGKPILPPTTGARPLPKQDPEAQKKNAKTGKFIEID